MASIQEILKEDVLLTNESYWNQFRNSSWTNEQLTTLMTSPKARAAASRVEGAMLSYLSAKVQHKDRRLRNLYREIVDMIKSVYSVEVSFNDSRSYLDGTTRLSKGDISLTILEDNCFIFNKKIPVLQVRINRVAFWSYLIPSMMQLSL